MVVEVKVSRPICVVWLHCKSDWAGREPRQIKKYLPTCRDLAHCSLYFVGWLWHLVNEALEVERLQFLNTRHSLWMQDTLILAECLEQDILQWRLGLLDTQSLRAEHQVTWLMFCWQHELTLLYCLRRKNSMNDHDTRQGYWIGWKHSIA